MKGSSKIFIMLSMVLLTACGKDIPVEAEDPSKAAKIELYREYQYTYWYDCKGSVTSEGYSTVRQPKKTVEIHPKSNGKIVDSNFHNITTDDKTAAIINYTVFTINLSPTWLDLKVNKGLNKLKYTFKFSDREEEVGYRYVDVRYSEFYNEEPLHIHPSAEECEDEGDEESNEVGPSKRPIS